MVSWVSWRCHLGGLHTLPDLHQVVAGGAVHSRDASDLRCKGGRRWGAIRVYFVCLNCLVKKA